MKKPDFETGDLVIYMGDSQSVGKVIGVRKQWTPFPRWIYDVQWRDGVQHVPMFRGLTPAEDAHVASSTAQGAGPGRPWMSDASTSNASLRQEEPLLDTL